MSNIHDALVNLGYPVKRSGNYFTMPALYRGGDNPTALSINQETGRFRDFVSGARGSWRDFLRLALDGDPDKINKYLQGEFSIRESVQPNPLNYMQIKKYDKEVLNRLIPFYDFYLKKGISKETLKRFQAGFATAAKLKNRIVFPIIAQDGSIIGFAGRLVFEHEELPKWLIVGRKTNFTYPLHLTHGAILNKREVILVESVGDVLSLMDSGVENVVCIFGVSVQKQLLKSLISLNPKRIILALNNDSGKIRNAGQTASSHLKASLSQFFDNIDIVIPPNNKNDWGDCSPQEIKEFFNETN